MYFWEDFEIDAAWKLVQIWKFHHDWAKMKFFLVNVGGIDVQLIDFLIRDIDFKVVERSIIFWMLDS